ncbi:MAG: tetratricopeptide repeat protein [Caedimonas sp.]|nr:tetratricopeptide repeat protein [Caedimonas sp.]
MKDNLCGFPLEISYQSFKNIHGVAFTSREIDVIACIVSGKFSTKTIASILSISLRTVEIHVHNIRSKLECTSREGIINFIEKAGKFAAARQHYLYLCIQSSFEQKLQHLSALVAQNTLSCLTLYEKQYEVFIEGLRPLFKALRIEGIFREQEIEHSFNEGWQGLDVPSVDHYLFVLSPSCLKKLFIKDPSLPYLKNATFISLEEKPEINNFQEREEFSSFAHIHFDNSARCYLSFFDLFKKLFPNVALDKLISELKEHYEIFTNDFSNKDSVILTSEEKHLEDKELSLSYLFVNLLKKQRGRLFIGSVLCGAVFCTFLATFQRNEPDKIIPIQQIQKTKAICSDLPLPHEDVLLKRPTIMKSIEKALKGEAGIQTVALVGIGGAGKTTIARHYAQAHKTRIVWEINAETQENLKSSFESLAYALAQTEEDKGFLSDLEEIKEASEKERQIIHFVKQKLKLQGSWLLIYDNVDNFSDIRAFFPIHPTTWGNGKVILTTRNTHIGIHPSITKILSIPELEEEEKFKLFMKIMAIEQKKFPRKTKIETQNFLTRISPFPLDVSISAFYIKATDITYEKYLDYLNKRDEIFTKMQENILKDMTAYHKTRYRIITLSLQQMIEQDKDFHDLLLFLSLIDSQDIPLDLLYTYKTPVVVDKFIYYLRKHSLVTKASLHDKNTLKRSISIHRATHNILYQYLIPHFKSAETKFLIQPIGDHFEHYISQAVEREDYDRMKLLIRHGQIFLSHGTLLAPDQIMNIQGTFGKLLHYLGHYHDSQQWCEKALSQLPDHVKVQRARLLYYLGDIYGSLGKREQSIKYLEESLHLYQKYRPTDHKRLAQLQTDLGNTYIQKNYIRAKALLENSLTLYTTHIAHDYTNIAWLYLFLGYAEESQGHFMQAKKWFEHSLNVCRQHLPDKPVKMAWALANIGHMEHELGHYQGAEVLLQQAYDLCQANLSDRHRGFAILRVYKGILERTLNHYQKAENLFAFAGSIFEKLYPEGDPWRTWVLAEQGILRRTQGHLEKAKICLEQAIQSYQKVYGDSHVKTAILFQELALTYLLQGKREESEVLLQKSLKVLKAHHHCQTYLTLEILSDLFLKKAKEASLSFPQSQAYNNQARQYLVQAFESAKAFFPEDSAHLQRIQAKLLRLDSPKPK